MAEGAFLASVVLADPEEVESSGGHPVEAEEELLQVAAAARPVLPKVEFPGEELVGLLVARMRLIQLTGLVK